MWQYNTCVMLRLDCDLLIIGSGFGGSVCALRAVEAGLNVVVLERGRRMTPAAFSDLAEGKAKLFHRTSEPGLIELHQRRGLLAVTGSAVGGGSHLYTAVTVPAPPEIFTEAWPDGICFQQMVPFYARVAQVIKPSAIPIALSRTVVLESIGAQLQVKATRLPLAMDWPDDVNAMQSSPPDLGLRRELVNLLQGGPVAKKRTLDHSYLRMAEELGAQVRPLHEVLGVAVHEEGYRVDYRRYEHGQWADDSLCAHRVVLAAGTLNTVRMLLKWRDVTRSLPNLSQVLGHRFHTNGDWGALVAGCDMNLAVDSGPPVTAWLDLWKQDRMYLMETGVFPIGFGLESFSKRWNRLWSFGVMGFDENPGTLRLGRGNRLVHEHNADLSTPFHRRRLSQLRAMSEASGGMLLASPEWMTRLAPATLHPMGGAAMAESPDRGVTNPFGEVFGYPGLFIADASLFPTPLGAAPSMTIAAIAEYVIENLVRRC